MAAVKGLLGRKVGMTRVFSEEGQVTPVTVIELGPCTVLQKKTKEREGYNAVQLGFMPKPFSRVSRPHIGHVEKAGAEHGFQYIKEFEVDDPDAFELGQVITLKDVDIRLLVDITGTTKGKGFAGTVKRHGFSRGRMGHGSKHHRQMGSIGQSAFPSRIIKGKRMPGRMGGKRYTIKNSMVVDIRPDDNLLLVKGAVPGARNQMVMVKFK